jgi:hypothetical protein
MFKLFIGFTVASNVCGRSTHKNRAYWKKEGRGLNAENCRRDLIKSEEDTAVHRYTI